MILKVGTWGVPLREVHIRSLFDEANFYQISWTLIQQFAFPYEIIAGTVEPNHSWTELHLIADKVHVFDG